MLNSITVTESFLVFQLKIRILIKTPHSKAHFTKVCLCMIQTEVQEEKKAVTKRGASHLFGLPWWLRW